MDDKPAAEQGARERERSGIPLPGPRNSQPGPVWKEAVREASTRMSRPPLE